MAAPRKYPIELKERALRLWRNEALFGAEGQRRIAQTKVAIVGLGGLGSHVAQQLAYLGVADYALVDPDIVTDSSLNRLVGAIDADVAEEMKKILVTERMIKAVKPDATVKTFDSKIDTVGAEPLIAQADVVFGCLDRDLARLQLTDICARHAKPYFDLASDTGGEGDVLWYGGASCSATARAALSASSCSIRKRWRATA